ncbi:ribosomal subunit interface protein [Bernardetia litoralis DSM 6794]|uniref:Ribosomal subunit interface protein n=1 Tax=Bernardetia litoralis (strain ATCC 23117 / DSM 6794 / NBRC 15988 / NCIMB 1366 / Fx l1 / Sio-4) TaxID=880071 RepID=I4ALL6_BERLS|nr:ribosome-associated translation inhibitor RaiA [Bernardetia litoralis]AFM04851.1 ribosomal subunit interface protein [Bernardetia litoralis DSM 6794]
MKLEMYYVDNDKSETLSDFIQTKVNKLETFYDGIINGEVYIRSEKGDPKKEKVIEIRLNVPGTTLFAKEAGETFEFATDETVEALRRQIKKFKEKTSSY